MNKIRCYHTTLLYQRMQRNSGPVCSYQTMLWLTSVNTVRANDNDTRSLSVVISLVMRSVTVLCRIISPDFEALAIVVSL